ncbi:MAG: thioredoxin-dependent thiol peroxidase [Bryobacterales bacterium]|nr:thioredoxin-dependent thiol peroxidase [Bryobacterales bacterium]
MANTETNPKELAVGGKAPEIKLQTDDDGTFKLSSLKGKKVVLYFYPKADTPGCTTESCQFRDTKSEFEKLNVAVIGISPDEPSAQAKFKSKFDLTFPLLADTEKTAANAYGVWVEKSLYGRRTMGVERATFLIGADGRIAAIWRKVRVKGHAEAVLEAVRALPAKGR